MNRSLIRIVLASALILNTAPLWAAASSSAKLTVSLALTDLDTGDLLSPSLQFNAPHGNGVSGYVYAQGLTGASPPQQKYLDAHDLGNAPFENISDSQSLGGVSATGSIAAGLSDLGPHTLLTLGSTGPAIVGKSLGYEALVTNYTGLDYKSFTLSARSSVTFLVDFELDAAITSTLSEEVAQAGFNLRVSPSQATIFQSLGVSHLIEAASHGSPNSSLHSSASFTFENTSANAITGYWLANAFARGSSLTAVPEADSLALALAGLVTVGMLLARRRVSPAKPSR